MHVIPGPCGLFRYSAMGTLREGLMSQYFRLFQKSSQGLIVGNVELVEDRIPGTLLSFPLKADKEEAQMPPEGWPRTGFVHEALFYIEAEKPLSQLIKQRRRWLNGTFATYIVSDHIPLAPTCIQCLSNVTYFSVTCSGC